MVARGGSRVVSDDGRYAALFEPLRAGRLELRARVFTSAHQPGLAEDGKPGPRYIAYQRARARAGYAMQITGATPIAPSRLWNPATMIVNCDEAIVPAYARLAAAVHAEGGRMLAQLMHPGAGELDSAHVVSASLHVSELTRQVAREIEAGELRRVVEQYHAAADRVRRGDMDGVELAIGWGYLLASFVSPRMNQRTDEYGGSLVNRLRFPREVIAAVRDAIGPERILGLRLCADELVPGEGITPAEAPAIAAGLVAGGAVDYVNVIAGTNMERMSRVDHWPATPAGTGIWRHLARAVRDAVDVPVCTVGRVTHPDVALEILERGDADLVGIARAAIVDPDWLAKARAGRPAAIRPCTAVNACINALLAEEPIHCMANPEVGREGAVEESDVGRGRTAVVVGAGPAGIEAARRLAARGFAVVLYEAADEVGGQVARWSRAPVRSEVARLLAWWRADLERRGVEVRLGRRAVATDVLAAQPALAVVATGSRPLPHPALAGATDALAAFAGVDGDHVLVADEMGRADAMLVADAVAAAGRRVTLATSCLHAGEDEGITTLYPLLRRLGRAGVEIRERVRVERLDGRVAHLRNVFDGSTGEVGDVDAAVAWCGAAPDATLARELDGAGLDVRLVGDALLPRRVADAVREGAEVAWSLAAAGG
jgi:2,4-dienoyl-CoA reductase-like NADH-dependent reductase (Old Yellow Enzyme family)